MVAEAQRNSCDVFHDAVVAFKILDFLKILPIYEAFKAGQSAENRNSREA